jgi:ankyrin repeat protein
MSDFEVEIETRLAALVTMLGLDSTIGDKDQQRGTVLLIACEKGFIELARFLVNSGISADYLYPDGTSPLMLASFNGNLSIVQFLVLEGRANPMLQSAQGFTALHIAARQGHLHLVKFFIECANVDVNIRGITGLTSLRLGVQENHLDCVQYLLLQGADPNLADIEGFTPLHIACRTGNYEMLDLLLFEAHADPNVASMNELTPLSIACQEVNIAAAKSLIRAGAEVETADKDDLSPLLIACQKGSFELVKLLVIQGHADALRVRKEVVTPLSLACGEGYIGITEFLVSGPLLGQPIAEFLTPLLIACRHKHHEVVKYLLEHSPLYQTEEAKQMRQIHIETALWQVCERGDSDMTRYLCSLIHPLEIANLHALMFLSCREGHLEVFKLLVSELDALPTIIGPDGFSPLFISCIRGHLPIVRYLALELKLDLQVTDFSIDATPLHFACAQGQLEVVKFLVEEAGASVTAKDKFSRTPTWTACALGHTDVVRYLFEIPNAVDVDSAPIEAVCKSGNVEMVKFLIQHAPINQQKLFQLLHLASQDGDLEMVSFFFFVFFTCLQTRKWAGFLKKVIHQV